MVLLELHRIAASQNCCSCRFTDKWALLWWKQCHSVCQAVQ